MNLLARVRSLDILITTNALALGVIQVTNNEREFCRVPGLNVENCIAAG